MKSFLRLLALVLPLLTGVFLVESQASDRKGLPVDAYPDERSLLEILEEIGRKYHVLISYETSLVRDVHMEFELLPDENLVDAFNRLLDDSSFSFELLEEKYVLVYKNDRYSRKTARKIKRKIHQLDKLQERGTLSLSQNISNPNIQLQNLESFIRQQNMVIDVTGTVSDENGEPLIGVNIQVKGTNLGTATDLDGHFTLEDVDDDAVLVVSYIGYQTQEFTVDRHTQLNIVLVTDSQLLDEVVVVGYGTQKKTNLTGAVSEINSEDLELRSVNSATQALQGLAPNLNIDINSSGGAADAGMDINIRGVGSLSNSSPYILINGVRASSSELSALNANEISSVSVLKDAASTAIYGAQAAFGVILIETKKGEKNQPFSINYSNSFRSKKRIFVPDFVN